MKKKLKKLAKLDDGRKHLKQFLKARRPLDSSSDEDSNNKTSPSVSLIPSLAVADHEIENQTSVALISSRRSLPPATANAASNANEDHEASSPAHITPRRSLSPLPVNAADNENEDHQASSPAHITPRRSLSPLAANLNNNRPELSSHHRSPSAARSEVSARIETLRRRPRMRPVTLYRLKTQLNNANENNDEDQVSFDNSLNPETREINCDGIQLYEVEGDEIYIGCNRMIQLAFWEYMKHRGPSVFLRELVTIYWGARDLVNRCFKLPKVSTEIDNRSPRKCFTPAKYNTLRQVFTDYLNETLGNNSKKKKILRNMNKQIGYKIRDLQKLNYTRIQ